VLSSKDGLIVRLDEDDKTRLVHWENITVFDTLDSCIKAYVRTVYEKDLEFKVYKHLEGVLCEYELTKIVGRFPGYFSIPKDAKYTVHSRNSKKTSIDN
jgi:hypothetical protein